MRVIEVCPLLDDALCIAALYLCICRMLFRLRRSNQRWRSYPPFLINENRWRAQRYGVDRGLVDFGKGEIVPLKELIDELLELVREDAEFFGCVEDVERARLIVENGTSADRQIRTFHELTSVGMSEEDALKRVVDDIIEETLRGTQMDAATAKPAKRPKSARTKSPA